MASLPHLLTNTITTTALSPPPTVLEVAAAASSNGSMAASPSSSWDSRISTSMLLIIAILAIIFFLSGLLHLLIRYLLTPSPSSSRSPHHLSSPPSVDDATALQGQLQQLFHLHDSGVDQSFIDALPIFLYRSIVTNAAKSSDPFDCAVCLCEFEPDDRLRLLPKCSHAFHLHCIDTWLLSHSTCPLCRRSLLPNPDDPLLLLLDNPLTLLDSSSSSASPSRSHTSIDCVSLANSHVDKDPTPETKEMVSTKDPPPPPSQTSEEKRRKKNEMVAVKLGKFRNNAGGEGSSTDAAITDRRRCFSMGSFEYVLEEEGTLPKAAILPPARKPEGGGGGGGHRRRLAMSECDCDSRRMTVRGKKESVSFSKTWLRGGGWGRKERARPASVEGAGGSRRSFRLGSEFDSGSEVGTTAGGFDVESFCEVGGGDHGDGNASAVVRRGEEAPSFARRTMLWVMGRGNPNKVGSHV